MAVKKTVESSNTDGKFQIEACLKKNIITIFGSRYPREGSADYDMARRLGKLLAENGYSTCTGGYTGIMEASSRGAREGNGHTIGVTVKTFGGSPNPYVIEEIRTSNLFTRLEKLMTLGNAYVVFRGGMGTIAELCLAWNLVQMRQFGSPRPIVLIGEFWNPLLNNWMKTTDIAVSDYKLLKVVSKAEEVIQTLKSKIGNSS